MPWDGGWSDGLPGDGGWADGDWADGLPLGSSPSIPPPPPEWKVEILIDDEIVWSAITSTPKQAATFNVSKFSGRKNLKFRLTRTA